MTKHQMRRAAGVHERGPKCTVRRQCMEIQCMDLRSQYTEKEVINYEALHGAPSQ